MCLRCKIPYVPRSGLSMERRSCRVFKQLIRPKLRHRRKIREPWDVIASRYWWQPRSYGQARWDGQSTRRCQRLWRERVKI